MFDDDDVDVPSEPLLNADGDSGLSLSIVG